MTITATSHARSLTLWRSEWLCVSCRVYWRWTQSEENLGPERVSVRDKLYEDMRSLWERYW